MRHKIYLILIVILASVFITSCAKNSAAVAPLAAAADSDAVGSKTSLPSPADVAIEQALELVEKDPDLAAGHLKLASAYLKKVRETGDYAINRSAESAIENALKIEPENFDANILQAQIFLSEHKFADGLKVAEKMEGLQPQNSICYVIKTDALTELGRYEEAVTTAQKLVDMKPNATSYTRVAHLRSLYGDTAGALEIRELVIKTTDPKDSEGLAWAYSQLGTEYFGIGKYAEAEKAYETALRMFPEYHWAMAGKGKTLAAKGDLAGAAKIFEALRGTPHTDREIYLADIYKKLGREQDAQKLYEEIAAREKTKESGDMHRVALMWADQNSELDEALSVAKADRAINSDLLASDTLAWALYKKQDYAEAKKYIAEAMRLKTRNALFYYHAGMIENALGNKKEAKKYLKLTMETNPAFDLLQSDVARQTLDEIRRTG